MRHNGSNNGNSSVRCHLCGKTGHIAANCYSNQNNSSNAGKQNGNQTICQICNKKGHIAANCRSNQNHNSNSGNQNGNQNYSQYGYNSNTNHGQGKYCEFCKRRGDHITATCNAKERWYHHVFDRIRLTFSEAERCMGCKQMAHTYPIGGCPGPTEQVLMTYATQVNDILRDWETWEEVHGPGWQAGREAIFGPGPNPSPVFCIVCDMLGHSANSSSCPANDFGRGVPPYFSNRRPSTARPSNGSSSDPRNPGVGMPEVRQFCTACSHKLPNLMEVPSERIRVSCPGCGQHNYLLPVGLQGGIGRNNGHGSNSRTAESLASSLGQTLQRTTPSLDQHGVLWNDKDNTPCWNYNHNLPRSSSNPGMRLFDFNRPGNLPPYFPPVQMNLSGEDIDSIENPASSAHMARGGYTGHCAKCGTDGLCVDVDNDVVMMGVGNSPSTALGGGRGRLFFRNANFQSTESTPQEPQFVPYCQCPAWPPAAPENLNPRITWM